MLAALAAAVLSVALGLALGLAPERARFVGLLRTLALATALTVVLTHLLPEALEGLGVVGLLVFVLPLIAPRWLALVRGLAGDEHEHEHDHRRAAFKAGYLGLLLHHVGDGLGLGAYAALPGGAVANADVLIALASHTVPLVAVVALAFRGAYGVRSAILASTGLAAASAAGVLCSTLVGEATIERASPLVAALVAGLLVHVVTHDLGRDLPERAVDRALDALAAVAGVLVCLVGGEAAGEHGHSFSEAFADVASTAAPALVAAGLALAFALRRPEFLPGGLRARLGPTLMLEGAVLCLMLAGGRFFLGYVAGVALLSGALLATSRGAAAREPARDPARGALSVIQTQLPWTLVALALALVFEAGLGEQGALGWPPLAEGALAVALALPLRLPPAAAALIALSLAGQGLDFGAAIGFAVVAAARDTPRGLPARSRMLLAGATAAAGLLTVLVATLLFGSPAPSAPRLPAPVGWLALGVVALFALHGAFQRGVRGFLMGVFPSHDSAAVGADGRASVSAR